MGRDEGRRFCLHHRAAGGQPRARVLYLHPLAEEMNRSRRVAALQARALADAGCAVLQIDLAGCGDSAGDFADATWQDWIGDALAGASWLRAQHPGAPLWLWGLRAGALLAVEAARALGDTPCSLLLWQPPMSGRMVVQHFLRLRVASGLQAGGGGSLVTLLRAQLASGHPVEAAGYVMSPRLAAGLEAASMAPSANVARLAWLECVSAHAKAADAADAAPAAAQPLLQAWRATVAQVHAARIVVPAFWFAPEVEAAPALLQASVQAVAGKAAPEWR